MKYVFRLNMKNGVVVTVKSQAGELTREIDKLARSYVADGDVNSIVRASKLSKDREKLLQPYVVRAGKIKA